MIYLKKCPRCNEGRYCCQEHCNLDWDRHKLLCRDIKLKVGLYKSALFFRVGRVASCDVIAIPNLTPSSDVKQRNKEGKKEQKQQSTIINNNITTNNLHFSFLSHFKVEIEAQH